MELGILGFISNGINWVLNLSTFKGYLKQLAASCTHRDSNSICNSEGEVINYENISKITLRQS